MLATMTARIVVVANTIPMRDRSAGWFRFFCILRILAKKHEVHLHPVDLAWQYGRYGRNDVDAYRLELEKLGVRITSGQWSDLSSLIRAVKVDMVLFEYYKTVTQTIVDYARFFWPRVRIVIDSIDVVYNRLMSKAALTGRAEDVALARKVKAEEIAAYSLADLVVSISDCERALLEKEFRQLRVEVIPLIFRIAPLRKTSSDRRGRLLFVADYGHDANVDAIVHFCTRVLPLIVKELPEVQLSIVGHSPPVNVTELAGPNVQVLGYVADIATTYASSDIAIAPMRFGGGLKGKVAEAMCQGVPVVATSASLEGFLLVPDKDVLVGDSPEDFARAVLALLRDEHLYQGIRENGWKYAATHFSEEVVGSMLEDLLERVAHVPTKKLSLGKRVRWTVRRFVEQRVLWRFRGRFSQSAQ
jgi:O-antigen biosynthesis protein